MNEIVNKFLLVGDKVMPEMNLKQQPVFTYSACGPFTKKQRKNWKILCRQEIQILFIKMTLLKRVFNTIWLMANQKI